MVIVMATEKQSAVGPWPAIDPPGLPGADEVPFEVSDSLSRVVDDGSASRLREVAADLAPAGAGTVLRLTASVCPGCVAAGDHDQMLVAMCVFEADGEIRLRKRCPDHGPWSDRLWHDASMYHRARQLDAESRHPTLDRTGPVSGIGNITVTNRCDRSCHYCFFYAESGEPLHEPTKAEVESMAARLGSHPGIGAIQLTGGEPTVREDIVEIVEIAAEHTDEVLLNSHGGRFLTEPELAAAISDAGARGLYTSFDGVDPERNPKNYWEFPHALTACHDTGMCAMLVPTVIDGWNDHQLGDIVRFGAANADTVCGVNFQPVSLIGRMDGEPDAQGRITISGVIERIEQQTGGTIGADAWVPLPVMRAISEFKRQWTGDHLYGVTSNFSSWMVTAVVVDGDELYPMTDLIDVEYLMRELVGLAEEFGAAPDGMDKLRVASRLLGNFGDLLGPDTHGLTDRLRAIAGRSLRTRELEGIDELYDNLLPVGIRRFQDPYNYDLGRVADCDVQYAMPDGRVVPFSVYNVFPDRYRDQAKAANAIDVDEWLERDYARLESAADDRRTRRSSDVIDETDHQDRGVFGADLTYTREYDRDRRERVEAAYRASLADLDPVWSVLGEVVDADTDSGGCCCSADGC
ncbi:MAG: putative radical SAM superfamily Fe-S cluster-containing enzyme [Halovenus sp.]|jgi:uncharacterized radical SAM superfamily Fe-S cluster-containing enzyme